MLKKKSAFLVTVVLSMALAFTGCGNKTADPTTNPENNPQTENGSQETGATQGNINYQYYTGDQLKAALDKNEDMLIIDTQSEADFKTGHIKGAIATNAEMLENDTQKAQMDIVAEQAASAAKPIVIVSNDGGLSAENAHKYLVEKGIKTEQIFILEKGQKGWTFADLTEKTL